MSRFRWGNQEREIKIGMSEEVMKWKKFSQEVEMIVLYNKDAKKMRELRGKAKGVRDKIWR